MSNSQRAAHIELQPVAASDYETILELNSDAVPDVNLLDRSALQSLHEQAAAFIVARDTQATVPEDSIGGFMLLLDAHADYASVNYQYFKHHYESFLYVDRIVVRPDHQRMGIGRRLYEELFRLAGENPATCEVNVRPPNPRSLAFHEELGFQKVDEQDTEGGSKRVALLVRTARR
jgi:predicted GNAT superfamily acetyltransferase